MTPGEWSKAVIQRDGRCADCGALSPLHAHHVRPQALYPELRFDVANGVAVCQPCHMKRHRDEGKPRSQAVKRTAHRKTLLKLCAWQEGRIAELTAEVRRLNLRLMRLGK